MRQKWVVALAGIFVMLGPGALYAFSLFTQPLIAGFGWSTVAVTWAFALANFFLGLGAAVGGSLQDRLGPRRIALIGIGLWGFGNLLAGLGTQQYGASWLYFTYGVIGGFGCGMAYIAALGTSMRVFPLRRGLGGGLVVGGFGLGAFVYSFILQQFPAFTAVSKQAAAVVAARANALATGSAGGFARFRLDSDQVHGLMGIFIASGIAFVIFGALCALVLPLHPAEAGEPLPIARNYTTGQMLAEPQFYILWLILFLNVTAGIIVISNAVPIMLELTALPLSTVAATYGAIAVFNGLGRFFWGTLSDYIGRRTTLISILGIQVVVFMFLGQLHDLPTVAAAYAIVLLCYGGGFGTMPAFNTDFFGTKHFGGNYGLNITAWGCAGIFGPWFSSTMKDLTGSYSAALEPVALMLLVAIIFPMIAQRPFERARLQATLNAG